MYALSQGNTHGTAILTCFKFLDRFKSAILNIVSETMSNNSILLTNKYELTIIFQ